MIRLNSEIEGKAINFGEARRLFKAYGCSFCSNFEYDRGKFDSLLWREGGESIYLRIPFDVVEGALDHSDAHIQFRTPYVIKHVVNVGLDYDENSLMTTTGVNQFQKPLDNDGYIRDKSRWAQAGEDVIDQVLNTMRGGMIS
ncbi:YugN family protein [Bacillus niameyensis]|uniref:YugN family protein n=1 Tax=Bacillus niameyensis TaxID=1522308 RepID=UPI00078597E0|nr:YugN family protein [Bacillus niameyensis]